MKKHLRMITLALASLLLLSACQSGGTEDMTDGQTNGGTTATGPAETDPATAPDDDTTVADTVETTPPEDSMALHSVYPIPTELTVTEGRTVSLATVTPDENAAAFADRLTACGLTVGEGGTSVTVEYRDLSADFSYGTEEAYILTVTDEGVSVTAQTERGAYYAIVTLGQLLDGTNAPVVTVKDAPRNALRGVIEGFYGTAWTHDFRKELFVFMGENKMNTYIYAPKDDAKHRTQWRSLYTGTELKRMQELIGASTENYVKFVYAISPGGDINLGTGYTADFEKLMAKCEQMYELGVRDFAIFLDDIPTLDAEGHAKLLNDFQTKFVETHEGVSDLIAITTEYCDGFLASYTDVIAPLIHEDIELMWTGPGVVPASITNQSLRSIVRKLNRKVFIWWNYPVNDVLVNNLYMGACEGLETTLYESITGLVANPMNQGNASLVPLFTTADYLWNPEAYDGTASLKAATSFVAPDVAEELMLFISMTCASPMNKNTDSVELKTLLDAYKADKSMATVEPLMAYFDRVIAAADSLAGSKHQALYKEISEWVAKFRAYGEMGKAFFSMEAAYANGGDMQVMLAHLGEYKTAEASISINVRYVSQNVLTPFFQTTAPRINTLLGQAGEVSFAPATPITDCAHYEDYVIANITDGDDSTFFWSAGTLVQASNNGVGYFGVDLGEVTDVYNIYVATGVAGRDALYAGAFEYSTDNKTWIAIEQGSYGDEILIEGLSIKARYVRMRCTDRANTNWTKVRSFEVNTTRTVAATPVINSTVTSTLPVYGTYVPNLACDKNDSTFFWSAREGRAGDYIQLDLGAVIGVSRISFMAGVTGHEADYIHDGELSYSADGTNWTVIGKVNNRETVYDVNVKARFFRVTVKTTQVNWITVSEFSATSDAEVSDKLALDEYFVPRTELLTLQDGHMTSIFAPKAEEAAGHSLRVTVGESGKVRIINLIIPAEGLEAHILDKTGKVIATVPLTYDSTVEAAPGSTVVIPLDGGLMIAEILW